MSQKQGIFRDFSGTLSEIDLKDIKEDSNCFSEFSHLRRRRKVVIYGYFSSFDNFGQLF